MWRASLAETDWGAVMYLNLLWGIWTSCIWTSCGVIANLRIFHIKCEWLTHQCKGQVSDSFSAYCSLHCNAQTFKRGTLNPSTSTLIISTSESCHLQNLRGVLIRGASVVQYRDLVDHVVACCLVILSESKAKLIIMDFRRIKSKPNTISILKEEDEAVER